MRLREDAGPFLKRWGLGCGTGGDVKVFWFFSSEKNSLHVSSLTQIACTGPGIAFTRR
jgi:hypothetical protein